MTPIRATIRSYQVGFGDCFLLTVDYDDGPSKHVLIDFGSFGGRPEGAPSMKAVANDIKERSGGHLAAVIATHRHRDHISGFETNAAHSAPGDIIASLEPELVIQPWTEDPDLAETATAPAAVPAGPVAARRRVATLAAMQDLAGQLLAETKRSRSLSAAQRGPLNFMGENNLSNLKAVKNLMTMAGPGGNEYLHARMATRLAQVLPGADVSVMGPPTVEQHAAVTSQTDWDPDEFWLRIASANAALPGRAQGRAAPLFPRHVVEREEYRFPINTRWLINRAKRLRADQMLAIVRMLDDALNNTSLILLIRIGAKSFLFPGDAQIENWEYALSQQDFVALLADVDLYKVGHHGSRNATPKSLWTLLAKRSADSHEPQRLTSLMSTMAGVHGHEDNRSEVPRETLVTALKAQSVHLSTQTLAPGELYRDVVFELGA